jgi:glyoxylase-like metal-dependent hydrolase (beta-lactamase superfamily II)
MTNNLQMKVWEEYGIVQIPISMAPPLRWINSDLLRGPEGVTIVDPGPHTSATEQEWRAVWQQLGIVQQDVVSIVLTHHHPDHYGLAGYLQSLTGVSVTMSQRAHEEVVRMWGSGSAMERDLPALFQRYGMPSSWSLQLEGHLAGFVSQVTPEPEVSYIPDNSLISMGGHNWRVIESGGHAPGHLSFYDEEREIILCGDAVLPQISPNVSFLPGSDPEPLQSFMDSLSKLGQLNVKLAFPGHRGPFSHFTERTKWLIKHHEERLSVIEAMLQEGPKSGFEVCTTLFGSQLGIHQMRFAMSEALAHLVHLVQQGRVTEVASNDERGIILFSPI